MPERLKRSKAWNHFSKIDEASSQCNLCKKTIANKGGTTTNLLKHLSAKHGITHVSKCAYTHVPSTGATEIEPAPDVGVGTSAGNILMINVGEHLNGGSAIKQDEDDKGQVAFCLQLDAYDHVTGSEHVGLHHNVVGNPVTHNATFQEVMYPPMNNTPPAAPPLQRYKPYSQEKRADSSSADLRLQRTGHSKPVRVPRHVAVPSGAQQREVQEWQRRMEVLRCEMELLAGKTRAARQKERAARMKRRYYRAKLIRMGERAPVGSSSSEDEA